MYRLQEAIMHNGEAIKALINEEFGDGTCVQPQLQLVLGPPAALRPVCCRLAQPILRLFLTWTRDPSRARYCLSTAE